MAEDRDGKSTPTELSPVLPRERVATLDVLRGFALLGVLVANVFWLFSARQFERPADTRFIDRAAALFATIFVHGKAQTLLTFLFGFGFAVQLLRAQERSRPVMRMYVRRLVVLFAIGALHVTLLWWGDVTWTYAVSGFAFLLFMRSSNRTRIACAAALTFVPSALWVLPRLRGLFVHRDYFTAQVQVLLAALHGPSWRATIPVHVRFALVYSAPFAVPYFSWLVGRFLLGFVAGTQHWFDDDGARRLSFFRKLLGYGLLCDLPNAILIVAVPPGPHRFGIVVSMAFALVGELGTLGLTAAYVGAVALLMQRSYWRRCLMVVAPTGRMPLTTYISQSLICTFLFYGWGLGWAGHVSAAGCIGASVVIFAAQVLASHLWLRWFRFGPLEWIWRTLVYLRRQPMRLTAPGA